MEKEISETQNREINPYAIYWEWSDPKDPDDIYGYMENLYMNGFSEKQIRAHAILHGATEKELEKLPHIIEQCNVAIKEAEKEAEAGRKWREKLEKNGAKFEIYDFKPAKPLPLFHNLTKEQTKQKIESLKNETRDRAEKIINQLPAFIQIFHAIKLLQKNAVSFLVETGEDFFSTFPPYIPKWSLAHIYELIEEEAFYKHITINIERGRNKQNDSKRYKTIPPNEGKVPLDLEELNIQEFAIAFRYPDNGELENFFAKRKQLRAEIRRLTSDIEKTVQCFYKSNYYIAAKRIEDKITIPYEAPKGGFSLQEITLLYFFATNANDGLNPDDKDTITGEQLDNVEAIFSRVFDFFIKYANSHKTQYETIINFFSYDIFGISANNAIDIIPAPHHPHVPIYTKQNRDIVNYAFWEKVFIKNAKEESQEITPIYRKNGTPFIISKEKKEQAIQSLFMYIGEAKDNGYSDNGLYKIPKKKLLKTFMPKRNCSIEEYEEAQGLILAWYGVTGIKMPSGEIKALCQWDTIGKDYICVRSPALEEVYKKLYETGKKTKDGRIANPWLVMLEPSFIKKPPLVKELTAAIISNIILASRTTHTYHTQPEYLIKEHCPFLYSAIVNKPNAKEKTRLISRTFKGFYDVIDESPKFYNYFLPIIEYDEENNPIKNENGDIIKIKPFFAIEYKNGKKETGDPHPTFTNWREVSFVFRHGGINKNFKRDFL